MKLTTEQTKTILNENGVYTGSLLQQRFSLPFLKQQLNPLGNLLIFETPIHINAIELPKALILSGELINTSFFGCVSFYRLYLIQVGSILSEFTKRDWYLKSNCLYVGEQQATMSAANKSKESSLFQIIIPTIKNDLNLHFLDVSEEVLEKVKDTLLQSFYYLVEDVFIETQRDYF